MRKDGREKVPLPLLPAPAPPPPPPPLPLLAADDDRALMSFTQTFERYLHPLFLSHVSVH
jgi:hypothetical protein